VRIKGFALVDRGEDEGNGVEEAGLRGRAGPVDGILRNLSRPAGRGAGGQGGHPGQALGRFLDRDSIVSQGVGLGEGYRGEESKIQGKGFHGTISDRLGRRGKVESCRSKDRHANFAKRFF
jgi:hypothetical protein